VFALALGAALALARAGADAALTLSTVVLFTAVGAAGVLAPIVLYATYPTRGAARLGSLRGWLARNERGVLLVLALGIAAFFVRDGTRALGN
jgi:Sap-like sulfolipid-1-addressing protein